MLSNVDDVDGDGACHASYTQIYDAAGGVPQRSAGVSARCGVVLVIAVALTAGAAPAAARDSAAGAEPFTLGTVLVAGQRIETSGVANDKVATVVSAADMRRFNRRDVADAVNLLSGVTISTNSRNEKTVAVRGFDSRQVPLFIDGVPVYVPYDGYVDFNRFTTSDLAAIQVAKGFSSVAYGPNTLGGAINLVSRRPSERLESDVSAGVATGGERQASVNLGTNQGLWYAQAGASYRQSDSFRLSSDFEPTATEDGGRRNNARRRDRKLSLKIGLTPRDGDEYAIAYQRQDGEKGQPPSTVPADARYWKWPYWDKSSLYFLSSTALGDRERLQVRLYHDTYDNEVNSYTDATYTTLKTSGRGSVGTGRSIYDDEVNGGSVQLESTRLPAQTIRLVTHYKRDDHQETDANGTVNSTFKDALLSFAAEDSIRVGERWTLSLGVSRHQLRPRSVFSRGNPYSLPDRKSATDAQAGLFFDWSETARLYATVARKTRLPTLKDRYSQRLGTFIENPDLRPEESVNYELGYQGNIGGDFRLEAAVFYSDIQDRIQTVANVSGSLSQMQNVGKVRAAGVEFGLRGRLASWVELGGNFTITDLENRSDPVTRLTDVPREKATAFVQLRPIERVQLLAFAEHNSSRWASNTIRLGGFTTLGLTASYSPVAGAGFEAGVTNVTDRNYSLAHGFPNPGRMWFVNASYHY